MNSFPSKYPRLMALIIAMQGLALCSMIQAQNQGTYLFLEFSDAEPTPALKELSLIEVDTPKAGKPDDTASMTRSGMKTMSGGTTTNPFGGDDTFQVPEESSFATPSGSFSDSAFGEPAERSSQAGSTFFDEEAFTNPSLGD